jgi:hypothetical protein
MKNTTKRYRLIIGVLVVGLLAIGIAVAQDDRPKSPAGSASTQIGDAWIDVSYSRPILRGRGAIFGSGEEYGKAITGQSAPLWRVGANATTRIKTGLDLEINGTRVPAGEYSLFIDLKEGAWTAVLSSQPYMEGWDRAKVDQGITWGSYGYSADHDVVRAPMSVSDPGMSIDQMTIFFTDVTDAGGMLGVAWANQMGLLPFKVAQ